jgi:hypothetical protein
MLKMKKVKLVLVAMISIAMTSSAQVTAEFGLHNSLTKSTNRVVFNAVFRKEISEKIGISTTVLLENERQHFLEAITFSPTEYVKIALAFGLGTEDLNTLYRTGASILVGTEKNNFSALVEKGGGVDNYDYNLTLSHLFSQKFGISAVAARYRGTGLSFEYSPSERTLFFINPAYDHELKENMITFGFAWRPKMKRSDL